MSTEDSAFWRFSLRFYRRPEVADACIQLQDTAGLDVNLLFFIMFLAINQRAVAAEEMRRIDLCIREWRKRVVQPLRALRRDLKGGIPPINAAAAEILRSAIKRNELQAERMQQEILEREFPLLSTGAPAAPRVAAAADIAAYATLIGALPETPVNTLLTAFAEEFSL